MQITCAFLIFLSCSPIAKWTHVLLPFYHTYVLLALEFQKLWHRVMTICRLTEVKRQWIMLVLGLVTVSVRDQLWDVSELETFINYGALLVSLMALSLC